MKKVWLVVILFCCVCVWNSEGHAQSWSAKGGLGYSSFDNAPTYELGIVRMTSSRLFAQASFRSIQKTSTAQVTGIQRANQLHLNLGWSNCKGIFTVQNYFGFFHRIEVLTESAIDKLASYDTNSSGLLSGLQVTFNSGRLAPYANIEYALFGDSSDWLHPQRWSALSNGLSLNAGLAFRLN